MLNLGVIMSIFSDGNKVIVKMFRGTDIFYSFPAPVLDGTAFFSFNTATAEGRFSPNSVSVVPDFVFPVTGSVNSDSVSIATISFPSTLITEQIRENKIFWRINAVNNASGLSSVILYGEIWLLEV